MCFEPCHREGGNWLYTLNIRFRKAFDGFPLLPCLGDVLLRLADMLLRHRLWQLNGWQFKHQY